METIYVAIKRDALLHSILGGIQLRKNEEIGHTQLFNSKVS